ncbi:MAG: hypothetical protein WCF24_08500 [Acidimicrobiales bacterium]
MAHVRILQSDVDLERARDDALAFESAAAQALQIRIDRYIGLNQPRVVVPIPESATRLEVPPAERSEPEASREPDSGPETSPEGTREGFFSPASGVA